MNARELRLFREYAHLTAKETATLLRASFPRIDKTVISKCESNQYGVMLSDGAARHLKSANPDAARRAAAAVRGRKADRHRNTRRVSIRLTEAEFLRLQQHVKDKGMTQQTLLMGLLAKEVNTE